MTLLSLSSFIGVSELSAQNEWLIGGNLPTTDAIFGTNSGSLQHVRIHTNGSERMRVLSNGRIGIGTTTPFYSLSVHGTSPEPSIPGGENPPAPGTQSVIQVTNVESGQGQLAGLQMGLTGPNAYIRTLDKVRLQIQNQAANMHLHANGKITMFGQANTAQTPKLTLFSTVNENAFLIDNTGHDHGYSLEIKVNHAAVRALEVRNGETSNFIVDGDGRVGIGTNETISSHQLFVSGGVKFGSGISNHFVVENSGHVGIGVTTINTDYSLDVAGKIRGCELRVSNPGWCDYVFRDDYNLLSWGTSLNDNARVWNENIDDIISFRAFSQGVVISQSFIDSAIESNFLGVESWSEGNVLISDISQFDFVANESITVQNDFYIQLGAEVVFRLAECPVFFENPGCNYLP